MRTKVPSTPITAASTEIATETMPPAIPVETLAERTIRLKTEFETTAQQAIQELLTDRTKIDEQLSMLGYVPPGAVKPVGRGKPCRICGGYGHDARRHRWEKVKKNSK